MTENELRSLVAAAQKAQLDKPTRAVVNSESAFVMDRLNNAGQSALARRYWSWSCGAKNRTEFGDEVYELEMKLREIDKTVSMPSWGTYGT